MKRTNDVVVRKQRPHDGSAAEQLAASQESHALLGESLTAWCRERGLFAHHLTAWKAAFCCAGDVLPVSAERRCISDLVRKEKALSEAAALLILQKKFRALGGRG